jgi:hypothetical protein
LAIVTLVLWVVTAGVGVSLLSTGGAARRLAAGRSRAAGMQADPARAAASPVPAGRPDAGTAGSADAAQAPPALPRSLALPRTPDGKPPPVPRVTVATPPGEHPLLEFSHPALALTGLACWLMFVFVHYRPLAWISFGILLVTLSLGLTWLTRNSRDTRRKVSAAWRFPQRLVLAHGMAAAVAITLTVLTALVASRG